MISDWVVTNTGSCGCGAGMESARGDWSLVGRGVVADLAGRGRDPTGRAGRLFRRFERYSAVIVIGERSEEDIGVHE
jgi:hypothetical protein